MGYNSNCYRQDCYYNCCNSYGYCTSSYYDCYYYYNSSTNDNLSGGAVAGIVIGAIFFIFIVALTIYCIRRCVRRHQ